jgi:hypothetical protein
MKKAVENRSSVLCPAPGVTCLVEGAGRWLKELRALRTARVLQQLLQLASVIDPARQPRVWVGGAARPVLLHCSMPLS